MSRKTSIMLDALKFWKPADGEPLPAIKLIGNPPWSSKHFNARSVVIDADASSSAATTWDLDAWVKWIGRGRAKVIAHPERADQQLSRANWAQIAHRYLDDLRIPNPHLWHRDDRLLAFALFLKHRAKRWELVGRPSHIDSGEPPRSAAFDAELRELLMVYYRAPDERAVIMSAMQLDGVRGALEATGLVQVDP